MADYIDRNELVGNLDRFAPEHLTPLVRNLIAKQPTADVVEVKHGEWGEDGIAYVCNLCGESLVIEQGTADMNYCPHCGAKMDGGG